MISFRVDGIPAGEPRHGARAIMGKGKRPFASAYPGFSKSSASFRDAIRFYAQEHIPEEPLSDPLCIDRSYVFPRPKNHYVTKGGKPTSQIKPGSEYFHIKKPDIDNIDKLVFDLLQAMGFFSNDSIVSMGFGVKRYVGPYERPHAKIQIRELPNAPNDVEEFQQYLRIVED